MGGSWVGKRVLLTGGTGFLGAHVAAELRRRGPPAELLAPGARECDWTEQASTRAFFRRAGKLDLVIHAAGLVGGITANKAEPATFFHRNAAMGLNVLHEAREAGAGRFVYVGSVCAYPDSIPVPFREDDLWNGFPEITNGGYGLAKRMIAAMAAFYRAQHGFPAVTLLLANLYGPGDHFEPERSHVIPALVRKFVEAARDGRGEVEVWGTGASSREFLYVKDAARAVALAAERYDGPGPANVGTGRETTIREVAELIGRACGFRGRIAWDATKPEGQKRRMLDTGRAKALFGFEAETPIERGIEETVEWYRSRVVT